MKLPNDAKNLISLIISSGYKAYAVGGFVRDNLMSRPAGDIDITTSATPEQLEKVLDDNGIRYIETGIKHGTITAIVNHEPYEITTFRTDGDYVDNRHPESVSFVTDVKDDLARRDFTINAMAYNDNEGVIDAFGGMEDLKAGVIRAVGNPDARFKEDALRIMRAIRFSSTLGFNIEENTKKAIFSNMYLLENIAVERIYVELIKLLLGDNVENVLLEYRDVIAVIIPELKPTFDYPQNTKWHIYDVYTHSVKSIPATPKVDYMRLTMLLHDIAKPNCHTVDERGVDHFKGHPLLGAEMAKSILKRLRVSNDTLDRVTQLIFYHDDYIKEDEINIKHWLRDLGEKGTLDYIDIKIADLSSHNLKHSQNEIDTLYVIKEKTLKIIDSKEPYSLNKMEINGNDLLSLGYKGANIKRELDTLLEYIIAHPNDNKKSSLLNIARNDLTV